ncbi:hypothetical protein Bbelb_313970 [Branchiostoma belcheri]|nr:hypothetical protein Bbelb_313970 [Branchiostoma belcheri]
MIFESSTASSATQKWREDLRCLAGYTTADGRTAECDPDGIYPCCSPGNWCGNTADHCDCAGCVDYRDSALKPSDQSKKTQKCKPLTNKNKANITIPYVQGVSEKLRRIFQNFNIATNFKPHSTLRQRLVHPKDRPHKGTKANVFTDSNVRSPIVTTPTSERQVDRLNANGYSSAIFHHLQHNQGHSFKLESTDALDRETRWWERGVKEAIYERMYNPTLNREGGLRVDLSGTWDLALPAPRTDNT